MFLSIPTFILADVASVSLDRLRAFELHSELIFSILTKLFILVLVVTAIVFIVRVLMDSSYSIRNINVPQSFDQCGFTGPVIANRIYFRLQQIIERVNA